MKLITCVGYTCSGSSAVNNLLMEFENCCELTPHNECRFLQDPDGIADLEYNLFDNRHRLNSEYAIKRYRLYTNKYDVRNFKQIFGKNWKKMNEEYINELIQFTYNSYWHADIRNFNSLYKLKFFVHRAVRIIGSKFFNIPRESCRNYFRNLKMTLPISSRDEFLKKTQDFCQNIFESLNKGNKEFGIVDQLVPPSNIEKYMRYVKNLKVIVVDRDPRDIYLETITKNDRAFPKNVKQFCEIFKDSRAELLDNRNILKIQFEELIYNYQETLKTIMNFIGESEKYHINRNLYFSVEKSKENTKLWEKNKQYMEEIEFIEKELKEYLYKYKE